MLPSKRTQRKAEDRMMETSLGIRHHDPEAERIAGGNVYSSADIEALERHHTRYWRRRRRHVEDKEETQS